MFKKLTLCLTTLFLSLAAHVAFAQATLEQMIAQKIMLDLRYYCESEIKSKNHSSPCREPLTELPESLSRMISETDLGGVILFAENLDNIEQIIKLNSDLQAAAHRSALQQPLLISLDQEGGRVARIPRAFSTAFTGNMSIGATYEKHGTRFATETAEVLADELKVLGFNVNHAPNVDVNINPQNPVINVRSFSEDPKVVAELGSAQVRAMQDKGVIATIKHFPGHGDTSVDSHTGLPRVEHDFATLKKVDLAPFEYIIKHNAPGMIMTAHIQFPSLDSSTVRLKSGKEIQKPATMSRKIIHDLLRTQMQYQGVVVTDALDMAGISHFFGETEAVINTFAAGVDIALMPVKIQTPSDLNKLPKLISEVAQAVKQGKLDEAEITASYRRIQTLKSDYLASALENPSLSSQRITGIAKAKSILGNSKHRAVEADLAEQAITLIKGQTAQITELLQGNPRLNIIMPDTAKCVALSQALEKTLNSITSIQCTNLQTPSKAKDFKAIETAEVVIAGHISPKQSAVELGGMDDLAKLQSAPLNFTQQQQYLHELLSFGRAQNKKVVFISLRAPYETANFGIHADLVLATYAYNVETNLANNTAWGPAYSALAKVLTGKIPASGTLPVTIEEITASHALLHIEGSHQESYIEAQLPHRPENNGK